MTRIRRYFETGNLYFLTHVTFERKPILVDNFDIWERTFLHPATESNYQLIAWVVLPDHFHIIIDPLENDLSDLMKKGKLSFSARYRKRHNLKSGRVWQYRYWDHVIRNQVDLNRHIDYIHYNPVKHGLSLRSFNYKYSSFKDYVQGGYFPDDWGELESIDITGSFGE